MTHHHLQAEFGIDDQLMWIRCSAMRRLLETEISVDESCQYEPKTIYIPFTLVVANNEILSYKVVIPRDVYTEPR